MIHGAHIILYSKDPEADRVFIRDVLKYRHADAGQGWLIFALPPAEVAVHPSEKNDVHELYLMCDDVNEFVAEMKAKGITCGPLHEERWGLLTYVTLPGGGNLGVYEPRHASPLARPAKRAAARKPAKKPAPKKAPRKPAKKAAARRKARR